jgi:hypothetical protein
VDKEENKTYIKIAYRETDEHARLYWFITVFLIGFWTSVLIIMSVFGLSIRSLIIVGLVGSNATICATIAYYGHRLDVGRAYLEQAVSAIAKEPLF